MIHQKKNPHNLKAFSRSIQRFSRYTRYECTKRFLSIMICMRHKREMIYMASMEESVCIGPSDQQNLVYSLYYRY